MPVPCGTTTTPHPPEGPETPRTAPFPDGPAAQDGNKSVKVSLALTVLAVLWCAGAQASEVDVVLPLAVYGTAAGADYLSTRYALAAGAREANPLMRTPGSLAGWKAAQVGLLLGVDVALQRGGHRGKAKALRIGAAVVGASLVAWNWRTAQAQRRVR